MVTAKHSEGSSLVDELARVLPKDIKFTAHHLSTPPTSTEPLCYPPSYRGKPQDGTKPDQIERRARKPLKTYCEKHFLAISIGVPDSKEQVLALALEIYIYTTAHLSIIFVSKADSTGYLGLLKLPKGTSSPIREVTTTFISFLVTNRRRKGIQCVVNLFARAQSQYLFPGSVKNGGKHVLDDRGLVRWWCRVLDPLLEESVADKSKNEWNDIQGYIIIPGLDNYEMRAFLPRRTTTTRNWTLGHPLERISLYSRDRSTYGSNIPPRCLIPTYPDDPKARFVEELEDTTSERLKLTGGWRSPKTLDQFWEMMAFRQECSSGRMTGFIWLVFDPPSSPGSTVEGNVASHSRAAFIQTPSASFTDPSCSAPEARLLTPGPSQELDSTTTPMSSQVELQLTQNTPAKRRPTRLKKPKKVLKGRIIPRQPQIKTHNRTHFPNLTETAHYYWPEEGRGQVILNGSGYKRAVELLLHLEFGILDQAITSSTRWTNEVNAGQDWGLDIVGQREPPIPFIPGGTAGAVNVRDLSGMIKKKRPAAEPASDESALGVAAAAANTLQGGLVRKKAKVIPETAPKLSTEEAPKVRVLGSSLVRKKPKTS
ncbi:H3 K56 histone acetylation protein KAT11 [Xylariales sp. AK1849]|nr:H3 K56 histone acetylation protein KAT11 [Xylariales sp. AK1849]